MKNYSILFLRNHLLPIFCYAVLTLFSLLLSAPKTHAQVPQRFNYQGIARDAKGNPMSQKTMSLKVSVLPAADALVPEYEEMQQVTTNEFGLYTLQIGNGKALSGEMKKVQWETGNKYIRVSIDPQGGNNFTDAGTSQLLSVPYAIYADKAGMAKSAGGDRTGTVTSNAAHVSGDANFIPKFTAFNVIGKSQIFDNGTSLGVGTASPVSTASLHIRRTTGGQYLYLENPTASSFGSFRLYNDNPSNFATFTKYGSAVTGGYTGISTLYPFANMLGYGNNGPFLNAGTGNIGFAITKAGTNKLKIHIDAATERLGLGGIAVPRTQIHFNNTDSGNDTIKFTNQTSGHLLTDGTELRMNGNVTRLVNRENAALIFGTNNTDRIAIGGSGNVGINTSSPTATLDVNGLIRIQGGNPGAGKVLSSDANGLGSWQTPAQLPSGQAIGDLLVWNGNAWVPENKCNLFTYFFRDQDGDGFGDKFSPVAGCSPLSGFVADSTDCDDAQSAVNPNLIWYRDLDNDNFVDTTVTMTSCLQPAGFKRPVPLLQFIDCNDNNPGITGGTVYFQDNDNDGFGNPNITAVSCVGPPAGFVAQAGDCNDANPNVTTGTVYFMDSDGDGWGNVAVSQTSCFGPPQGFVFQSGDCNDGDPDINPGAAEACNTIDDDCDAQVDEGFSLNSDVNNCGFCGNVCNLPNAIAGCSAGQCIVAACNPGFFDADNNPANGCEVNLTTHCVINGVVVINGTTNPNSPCEQCNTAVNSLQWSVKPNGTSCPGGFCNNGTCQQ